VSGMKADADPEARWEHLKTRCLPLSLVGSGGDVGALVLSAMAEPRLRVTC
jgi:hypothetical protein